MSQQISSKQLMIGLLIVVMLVLVYIYVYSPLNKEINDLQVKRNELNQQLNELLAIDRTELKKQEKELLAFQQGFLGEFPCEIKEKIMVVQLFNLLNATPGIIFKNISLSAPQTLQGDYSKVNVSMALDISGSGKYDAIEKYLARINEFRPRVTAYSINMSAQNTVPSGAPNAVPNTVQNSPNPDIAFNLKLKFTGYSGQHDQKYAIIDPNFTNDIYEYKSNGSKGRYNPFGAASGPSISSVEKIINNLPANSPVQ